MPNQPISKRRRRRTKILASFFVLSLTACEGRVGGDSQQDVIARVNGEVVTAEELNQAFWSSNRDVRTGALARGGRHLLLDLVVEERLLCAEAHRRGHQPTHQQMRGLKYRMSKRFLDAEFEHQLDVRAIPDAEVRAEFERSLHLSAIPSSLEIELVVLPTEADASEALRAFQAADGDESLDMEIRRRRRGQKHGGVFTREEAERFVGSEIAEAAFSLPRAEALHSEIFDFLEGFAVLVVHGRFEGVRLSYERVEPQIRQRLARKRWDRALNQFVESFRAHHRVRVFDENAALVPWNGES